MQPTSSPQQPVKTEVARHPALAPLQTVELRAASTSQDNSTPDSAGNNSVSSDTSSNTYTHNPYTCPSCALSLMGDELAGNGDLS